MHFPDILPWVFTFSLVLHASADLSPILRFFGSLFLATWIDNNYYSTYCSSIVPGAANANTGGFQGAAHVCAGTEHGKPGCSVTKKVLLDLSRGILLVVLA